MITERDDFFEVTGTEKLDSAETFKKSIVIADGGALLPAPGLDLLFDIPDDSVFTGNTAPGPMPEMPDFHPEDIGIWVMPGGKFAPLGTVKTPFVFLQAAGTGENVGWDVRRFEASLVGTTPAGWAIGDAICLVNERGDHEVSTVTGFDDGGSPIVPSLIPLGVLERRGRFIRSIAANLSRDIVLRGHGPGQRPHMAFMRDSVVDIQYVEIRNFGPRGKLGRYPIHFHHARGSGGRVAGCSIWQRWGAGNRFITIHDSFGVQVHGNVCLGSQGHGVYMENGNEWDCEIINNLTVDVRGGEELAAQSSDRVGSTHHYWVREGNVFLGNIAAGNNWNQKGQKNKRPNVNGFVLLPNAHATKKARHVERQICMGTGGTGLWASVTDVVWDNCTACHHEESGANAYKAWARDDRRGRHINPLYILNHLNEAFQKSGDWNDRRANGGQILQNWSDFSVEGGDLAGPQAVHVHYSAENGCALKGVNVSADVLFDVTYFEARVDMLGGSFNGGVVFSRGYGRAKRHPPEVRGYAIIADVAVNGEAVSGFFTVKWQLPYLLDNFREVPHSLPGTFLQIEPLGESERPPPPENQPPTVAIEGGASQAVVDSDGAAGELVKFRAKAGDDSGTLPALDWFLDGDVVGAGEVASFFVPDGVHMVEVLATDGEGLTASAAVEIEVFPPAPPPTEDPDLQLIADLALQIHREATK